MIDFVSEKLGDEGGKVLQPKSSEEIQVYYEARSLFDTTDLAPPSSAGDYSPGNFHCSDSVAAVFMDVIRHKDPDAKEYNMYRSSLGQKSNNKIDWMVLFDVCPCNSSASDYVSYLLNDATLKEGKVLISELQCMFSDIYKRLRKGHKKPSSTIVSGSDRDLRVMQCTFDSDKGFGPMRMSDIIRLDGNEDEIFDKILIILR
ncbi:hypothetical protein F4810DRAFT_711017 [Camillea tinctor]|nr:hypothetical protein F4810DRAFT_711017 [Camillea tinctor]